VSKPQEAIARIEKAIELDPNTTEFHYNLGLVLREVGLKGSEYELGRAREVDAETVQL
jgi:tetratricopeptide (TPR) repeat protein